MKNILKRSLILVLVLTLMASLLSGCKKNKDNGGGEENQTTTTPTGNVYASTFSEVKGLKISWVEKVLAKGNNVYMLGNWYDQTDWSSHTMIVVYDVTTGTYTEKELKLEADSNINGLIATKNGFASILNVYTYPEDYNDPWITPTGAEDDITIEETTEVSAASSDVVLTNTYIGVTDETIGIGYGDDDYVYYEPTIEYYVVFYDNDFNELSRVSIQEIYERGQEDSGWFYVNDFGIDADDNIYVTCDTKMYVADKTGKFLFDITVDNYFRTLYTLSNGDILVGYYDAEYNSLISKVDFANKKLGEELKNIPDNNSLFPDADGNFYYVSTTKLNKYNTTTQKSEEIFDLIECDINTGNMNGFTSLDSGEFVSVSTNTIYTDDNSYTTAEIAIIKEVPASSVKAKKRLTLAMFYLDYDMQERVIKFNRTNEEYKVLLKVYSDGYSDDWEALRDKFNNDLASGAAADIYLCDDSYGYANLFAKGVFAPLDKFLENDPTYSKDKLIPGAVEALSYKGKMYLIGNKFTIQTLMGKTEVVGSNKTWTYKDVINILKKYPDASLMQYITKEFGLEALVSYSLDSFYDEETGDCHFDSDEFIALLELVNSFPEEYNYDEYESLPQLFAQNKIIVESLYLYNLSEISMQKQLAGGDVNLIGFPTNGESGALLNFENLMGISAKSKNQDGAWEFVKYYMNYDSDTTYGYWGFPITKEGLDKMLDDEVNREYDENDYWYYDDIAISNKPLTRAEADEMRNYIYKINRMMDYDENMLNIIKEDASVYFNGKKSAKEVAGIIQSRVQLYMDENR